MTLYMHELHHMFDDAILVMKIQFTNLAHMVPIVGTPTMLETIATIVSSPQLMWSFFNLNKDNKHYSFVSCHANGWLPITAHLEAHKRGTNPPTLAFETHYLIGNQ